MHRNHKICMYDIVFFLNMMCKYAHKTEIKTAGLAIFTISSWLLAGKGTTWILSSANAEKSAWIVRQFHIYFFAFLSSHSRNTLFRKRNHLCEEQKKTKKTHFINKHYRNFIEYCYAPLLVRIGRLSNDINHYESESQNNYIEILCVPFFAPSCSFSLSLSIYCLYNWTSVHDQW